MRCRRHWCTLAVIDVGCHTRHLQERADVGRVRLPLTVLSGRCRYVARPSVLNDIRMRCRHRQDNMEQRRAHDVAAIPYGDAIAVWLRCRP